MMKENLNLLKAFSNVPQPRREDAAWLQASTATREDKEIVVVKIAPSKMFDVFAEEYVSTIDAYWTGLFAGNRPDIENSVVFKETGLTEEEIIVKYANTILWATVAANKRQYQKEANLKTLFNHIRTQRVNVPVLLINAINCVGPVDIAEKAIRLEVEFSDKWDYKNEILTLEQLVAVSSWFEQLSIHGFDTVEYVKLGADGVRDFMMMTLDAVQAPSDEENPFDVKFVVRSEKIAANIVGMYRYFFYTENVKYLSDSRRIFKFGTFETNEAAVRSIVKTMLKIDRNELFSGANSLANASVKDESQDSTESSEL